LPPGDFPGYGYFAGIELMAICAADGVFGGAVAAISPDHDALLPHLSPDGSCPRAAGEKLAPRPARRLNTLDKYFSTPLFHTLGFPCRIYNFYTSEPNGEG
jgi:hypothetical protein